MAFDLEDLKKDYKEIEKKYKLPEFKELNEHFEIDRVDRETENILRAIRKTVMEKVINTLSFLEMLLNPVNAPRMYMPYVNSMSVDDVEIVGKAYKKLGNLILLSLELEMVYDEKKEAEVIKESLNVWKSVNEGVAEIVRKIGNPDLSKGKKEKNYFG